MQIRLPYEIKQHYNRWKVIVLITWLTVASSDLLPKPENSWAKNGDPNIVIFKCKSTLKNRLNWLIKTTKSSAELLIFNGRRVSRNVTSYCKVTNGEPGKYDLNLTATTKAAQQYVCQEPETLIKASAELIIIESDPECHVTKDGELTTFTCSILLHGNWAPAMECRNDNSDEVIGEGVYNISTPSGGLSSRVIVPTNHSQDPTMFYTCTTKFRLQEKPSDTTADNIPQYTYAWNSTKHTAELHKGDGDNARDTTEFTDGMKTGIKQEVVAAVVVSVIALVTIIMSVFLGRLYYKKKKTSNCKEVIPKEEIVGFI